MREDRKSLKQMMEEATAEITRVSAEDALTLANDDGVIWVDIRDVRELWRDGTIPNSVHAPRGMLEWWVDPDSPYCKEVFGEDKKFVLF